MVPLSDSIIKLTELNRRTAMTTNLNLEQLTAQRDALCQRLADISDFRPGNLTHYKRKCGKPNCHCAQPGDSRHPMWILTRKVKGKTVSNGIPNHAVERTRAQMQEYKHFQNLVKELIEVSDAACHAQAKASRAVKKYIG